MREIKQKKSYGSYLLQRYKYELDDKIMDFSDVEPPFLHDTVTLRKTREETVNEHLELKGPKPVMIPCYLNEK